MDKLVTPHGHNLELAKLLQSWCDYIVENFDALESGLYRSLRSRPTLNYKQLLT